MYNRIYESMFEGSMVGTGAFTFAVWSYVLGKMKPSRKDSQFYVEINPVLLGAILGEDADEVASVIKVMCGPDEKSRSKDEGGARLVREGQFLYRVVNGAKYNDMRSYEERREYQRVKQAEYRKRKKYGPSLRERQEANPDALHDAPMPQPVPPTEPVRY